MMTARFLSDRNRGALSLLCLSALTFSACGPIIHGDNAPRPAPIVPGAAEAITPGAYEEPTNAWLHEGYLHGVAQSWEAPGSHIGVSADGGTIALKEKATNGSDLGDWVGRDIRTGEEKWRNSTESKNILLDTRVPINGVAFGQNNGDKEDVLYSIDLGNGKAEKIGTYDSQKYYFDSILGLQHGNVYIQVMLQGSHGLNQDSGIHHILAFREGQQQWVIEAGRNPTCELADGALVCTRGENPGAERRIDIYNSATGQRAAEIPGNYTQVAVYRDTIAVQKEANSGAQLWSLQGKEKGSGPLVETRYLPNVKYSYEITKAAADMDARVLNVEGVPLLTGPAHNDGNASDPTVPSALQIPQGANEFADGFFVTESGKGFIWGRDSDDGYKSSLIDLEGKETPLDISTRVNLDRGILYSESTATEKTVTVYPPQE